MSADQKFEDAVQVYETAHIAYMDRVRRWIAERVATPVSGEKPLGEDDYHALEMRYGLEHPDELKALALLESDVRVLRAELDRRWIEAHEDLAGIRRAAEGLQSFADPHKKGD